MFAAAETAPPVSLPSNNPPSRNPFEVARSHLIKRLVDVQVPQSFGSFPSPTDFEAVAGHIREIAEITDEWLAAVGFEIADNSTVAIDLRCFSGAFIGAVDGNATYCADEAASALREGRRAL